MSSPVQSLVQTLSTAYRQRESRAFENALILRPRDPRWAVVKDELKRSGVPSEAFLTKIFAPSPSDERSLPTALIPLIGNYLEYVRDVEWRDDGREVVTKEEAGKDWKVMDTVYGETVKVFMTHTDNAWIGRGMKRIAEVYLELSFRASRISKDSKKDAVAIAMRRIQKSFQVAAQGNDYRLELPDDGVARRGDVVFAMGNLCWKIYDQIQAYSLFDGIHTTFMNYVKPSIQARLNAPATSKADRVGFWYWRGKMRLGKGQVREARDDLKLAFDDCAVEARNNLKAIFIRLVTCQIILGRFPIPTLLDEFNLQPQFAPLIQAIKTGNRAQYYDCFWKWSEWYRRRGIWLVLREKGEVLVWRSLVRETYKIYRSLDPANAGPRCSTAALVKAARLSWGPTAEQDGVDLNDVISILSSLIDQSYIIGHISFKHTTLLLRATPTDPFAGFPVVASVRPRKVD